eukprot:TRINITY_DN8473_c0_g1_i1.p1 TRINITY_DN8473_c0_g1~~TRINITY_DN8473_c0_g1_i1.p1  ORF type:complete len:526 (-),score=44.93 TRINITY_DN8473_c0_g1_i1:52-1629(-)
MSNNDKSDDSYYTEESPLLRHQTDAPATGKKLPISAAFILSSEFCERFAYYGATLNFTAYMVGPLGFSDPVANVANNGFQFWCYFTSIIGGILADVVLTRYNTILNFSSIYLIGLLILSGSAFPFMYNDAKGLSIALFCLALFLIGLGTGGIKSNVSTFVADQVRHLNAQTLEGIFRWFYWIINVGSFAGMLICSEVKNYKVEEDGTHPIIYWVAYLIPAVMFFFSIIALVGGRSTYKMYPEDGRWWAIWYVGYTTTGSIVVESFSVISTAIKNRLNHVEVPNVQNWLDYAKPNFTEEKVNDLKMALRACTVFIVFPIYWVAYNQMSTNLILQAMTMEHPSWLEAQELNLVDSVVLIILVPIFDLLVYPLLERKNINLNPIQRITIGFFFATIAMTYAALLQNQIYNTAPHYDHIPKKQNNDIEIWWQIPPYIFIAISEIFTSISGLEFAYSQSPASMKSVVMATFLFTTCIGNLLGMAVAPACVDPYFTWVYAGSAIACFITMIIFYVVFRNYKLVSQVKEGGV